MSWLIAIVVGGLAGFIAEKIMKADIGLLMNIVLGIVGASVANWLFGLINISVGPGWLGYLIAGTVGACILIFLYRLIRGRG